MFVDLKHRLFLYFWIIVSLRTGVVSEYGMPSNHSQYMGFFAMYIVLFLCLRQVFCTSTQITCDHINAFRIFLECKIAQRRLSKYRSILCRLLWLLVPAQRHSAGETHYHLFQILVKCFENSIMLSTPGSTSATTLRNSVFMAYLQEVLQLCSGSVWFKKYLRHSFRW